jgi:hypothetical protein
MDPEGVFTGASGFCAVILGIGYRLIQVDTLVTGLMLAVFGAILGYFAKRLAEHMYNELSKLYFCKFKPWIKSKLSR